MLYLLNSFPSPLPPAPVDSSGVLNYLLLWVETVAVWFRTLVVFPSLFGISNVTMFDCLTSGTVAAVVAQMFMPWEKIDPEEFNGQSFFDD